MTVIRAKELVETYDKVTREIQCLRFVQARTEKILIKDIQNELGQNALFNFSEHEFRKWAENLLREGIDMLCIQKEGQLQSIEALLAGDEK